MSRYIIFLFWAILPRTLPACPDINPDSPQGRKDVIIEGITTPARLLHEVDKGDISVLVFLIKERECEPLKEGKSYIPGNLVEMFSREINTYIEKDKIPEQGRYAWIKSFEEGNKSISIYMLCVSDEVYYCVRSSFISR